MPLTPSLKPPQFLLNHLSLSPSPHETAAPKGAPLHMPRMRQRIRPKIRPPQTHNRTHRRAPLQLLHLHQSLLQKHKPHETHAHPSGQKAPRLPEVQPVIHFQNRFKQAHGCAYGGQAFRMLPVQHGLLEKGQVAETREEARG